MLDDPNFGEPAIASQTSHRPTHLVATKKVSSKHAKKHSGHNHHKHSKSHKGSGK